MLNRSQLNALAIVALMPHAPAIYAQTASPPTPTKPLSALPMPNAKQLVLAPDFEVMINHVKFSCATNDQTPFVTLSATVKNKGGPFDRNKSISWRWGVDGVTRSANNVSPWGTDIDSPSGRTYDNLTIPLSWFENKGKKGLTKLSSPLSVRASFEFDTTAVITESNESNNLTQTLVTIPAMLCPN